MENGFYFYQNQLNQSENYNKELIRICAEVDKKLRITQRVYFEILEERAKFLICIDNGIIIITAKPVKDIMLFRVMIPKTFEWDKNSDWQSLDSYYDDQTKYYIAKDKKNIRVLLNGIVKQCEFLIQHGVESTDFKLI